MEVVLEVSEPVGGYHLGGIMVVWGQQQWDFHCILKGEYLGTDGWLDGSGGTSGISWVVSGQTGSLEFSSETRWVPCTQPANSFKLLTPTHPTEVSPPKYSVELHLPGNILLCYLGRLACRHHCYLRKKKIAPFFLLKKIIMHVHGRKLSKYILL